MMGRKKMMAKGGKSKKDMAGGGKTKKMMAKGGKLGGATMSVAKIRAAAKDMGYKLVKMS
jgi:hypothetical protein